MISALHHQLLTAEHGFKVDTFLYSWFHRDLSRFWNTFFQSFFWFVQFCLKNPHHIGDNCWHKPSQSLAQVLVVWVSMDPHPPDGSWGCGSPTMPAHSAGWPGGTSGISSSTLIRKVKSGSLLNFGWIYDILDMYIVIYCIHILSICMYICIYTIWLYPWDRYTCCSGICICIYIYVYMYIYICIYVYIYICIYIYI